MNLSVIICTHNPRADYLRRTLEALRSQTLPLEVWELLLIDNASSTELADEWDLSWHPRGRHVREQTPGLTPARLRGMHEASAELLLYLDDDNVVAPDYLEQAVILHESHAHLGAIGAGSLEPEFEVEPPAELHPLLGLLALRTVSVPQWSNNPEDHRCVPWGAGLVVTRSVATAYRALLQQLEIGSVLDRRGQHLFSGGDDLFSWASTASGSGFGIFPQLRITHLITRQRLTRTYFLRLIHDKAYSNGVMHSLLTGVAQPRLDTYRIVRLLLHGLRNGRFSMRCQLAELRGGAAADRYVREHRLQPVSWAELTRATSKAVDRLPVVETSA